MKLPISPKLALITPFDFCGPTIKDDGGRNTFQKESIGMGDPLYLLHTKDPAILINRLRKFQTKNV